MKTPPETPPVKFPVPTIANPLADRVDLNTPRIAVLNSPEAARYTPVVGSDANVRDGLPTLPSNRLIVDAPASTVLALSRFCESQINVAWLFAAMMAVDAPPTPVDMVRVYPPAVVAFWT